jgi:hypothetical protein
MSKKQFGIPPGGLNALPGQSVLGNIDGFDYFQGEALGRPVSLQRSRVWRLT